MIVRTWRCDLPGCTVTAEDVGMAGGPMGWIQVIQNEAGISTTILCSNAHLVAWTGAVAIPQVITLAQARTVLADHRAKKQQKKTDAPA